MQNFRVFDIAFASGRGGAHPSVMQGHMTLHSRRDLDPHAKNIE